MTPIIGDPKALEMYSDHYICMLYHITDRTTFGSRNAIDVFRKLGLDAFHDEIVAQITDEQPASLGASARKGRKPTSGHAYTRGKKLV